MERLPRPQPDENREPEARDDHCDSLLVFPSPDPPGNSLAERRPFVRDRRRSHPHEARDGGSSPIGCLYLRQRPLSLSLRQPYSTLARPVRSFSCCAQHKTRTSTCARRRQGNPSVVDSSVRRRQQHQPIPSLQRTMGGARRALSRTFPRPQSYLSCSCCGYTRR